MKLGNEFWLILFREYISPKLFAVYSNAKFVLASLKFLTNPKNPVSNLKNSNLFPFPKSLSHTGSDSEKNRN